MRDFKVLLEAIFLRLPNESRLFGYFSTAYVQAPSASEAVDNAAEIVRKRLLELGDGDIPVDRGVVLLVRDIWEVCEPKSSESATKGGTLYPMTTWSALMLRLKVFWLRKQAPHLVRVFGEYRRV